MDQVWDHSPIMIPGAPSTNDNYNNGDEYFTGTFTMRDGLRRFAEKKYSYFSKDDRLFSQDTAYAARKTMSQSGDVTGWKYNANYCINRYFINHFWTHLDSVIVISYEGTDSLVNRTRYHYNNLVNLSPTRIETVNSKKEVIENVLTYTNELAASGNIYSFMQQRNMIDEVVFSRKEKNGIPPIVYIKNLQMAGCWQPYSS